jgi:periplasmic protein TonB
MFSQLVVSGVQSKTHKPWSVALSAVVQTMLLGIMVLVPLIYTEALPKAMLNTFLVAPAPPSPPPPPLRLKTVKARKVIHIERLFAPSVIPKNVPAVQDEQPVIYQNGIPNVGDSGELLTSMIGSAPGPPPPVAVKRIRVGGNVEAAAVVNRVTPEYPLIAKMAQVSGTVVLHAIIAKDGTVQELQYVSGSPLLIQAALDAVKEWRYRPTMLNGEPVEVDTTIEVVFHLGR